MWIVLKCSVCWLLECSGINSLLSSSNRIASSDICLISALIWVAEWLRYTSNRVSQMNPVWVIYTKKNISTCPLSDLQWVIITHAGRRCYHFSQKHEVEQRICNESWYLCWDVESSGLAQIKFKATIWLGQWCWCERCRIRQPHRVGYAYMWIFQHTILRIPDLSIGSILDTQYWCVYWH